MNCHPEFEHTAGDEGINCKEMNLPSDFEADSAVMEAKGSFEGSDYKFLSYKSVRALKVQPQILVQTDKSEYRPKQTVKLRVMALTYELRPSSLERIHEVWVTNPRNDRLAQWKDVQLRKGMSQMEFALSDEPELGVWTIHVKYTEEKETEEKVTFNVAESVLPKFEVKIEAPDSILRISEEESFKVCALYTHGGKVRGSLNATFWVEYSEGEYYRAKKLNESITKLDPELKDGCATVKLDYEELNQFAGRKREFSLIAKVKEAVTGTELNDTAKMTFVYKPYDIAFGSSSDKHIVGGFPYKGKLKINDHNGSPVGGVNLEICARLFTDIKKLRNEINKISYKFYSYTEDQFVSLGEKISKIHYKSVCVEQRVKDDGSLDFTVPLYDLPENVTKLSIKVKSLDAPANLTIGMLQPKAMHDVELTHSEATSALTIHEEADNPTISCSNKKIPIFLSVKANSEVTMSYFVSSGAALLLSGTQTIASGSTDFESEYVGDAFTIAIDDVAKPEDTILAKHEISLERPFSEDGRVASKIKLLVYTRDSEGRTLSSTRDYKAESCADKPELKWSSEKLNPGDAASIGIKGAKNSLCGYSVVDKSVDLVPNPNRVTTERLQELKEEISKLRVIDDENPSSGGCSNANLMFRAFERMGLFVMSDTLVIETGCDSLIDVEVESKERESNNPVPPGPPQVEAIEADFFGAPQAAMAVPQVATRLGGGEANFADDASALEEVDQGGSRRPSASRLKGVTKNKVELRNYFPETWLFDLVDLDEEGNASLQFDAPHTITTWVAEVVCSSQEEGMTVSDKSNLLVTQDFFADINMPYFVKRGEILSVNVSVFNNVERALPMKLQIQESEGFKSVPPQDVCVASDSNEIKSFVFKATELNEVNVTVEAKITDEAKVEGCDGSAGDAEGYTDVLVKPLQVKPEGYPVENVFSLFQCKGPEDDDTITLPLLELKLPESENLVEDSERAWVVVTGDIMAPALSNLGKLLKLPTGCGEQTMMGLAPNVYLMEYLNGTGKKDVDIERKAKDYMRKGYNREVENFRHSDGSYSVWGPETSEEGSMWLTSFVVKIFSQASKFISINERQLKQSMDWMVQHQMRTGCFPNKGRAIHNEIKGTDKALTTAVIITFLELKQNLNMETKDVRHDSVMSEAIKCAATNISSANTYRKALLTYAISLHNKIYPEMKEELDETVSASELLDGLLQDGNSSIPGQLFWTVEGTYVNKALEVETTAYVVLSLVMHDRLPEALAAIRWMSTKRNSQGGFISTQDTMVALQAMSQYSLKLTKQDTNLEIAVREDGFRTSRGLPHDFKLTEDDKLLVKKWKVPQLPSTMSVDVSGTGCYMVQTVQRYNVYDSPEKDSFTVTAKQSEDGMLQLCASYVGAKDKTDMVVIELELLSGFAAKTNTLEALKNELEAPLKKYEYDDKEGRVVLYFDSMPKESLCLTLGVKETAKIGELKPALVKIYDYYDQDDVFETNYNL